MPKPPQVPDILKQIDASILREHKPLKVTGSKLEDGWLTVVVEPTKTGIRASEYADFMSQLERTLRAGGFGEVVLVPALAA